MTPRDQDLLLRFLEGTLAQGEAEAVQQRLRTDPAFRQAHDAQAVLYRHLSEARADSFAPYFADRVMRGLTPTRETAPAGYESLQWVFARLALACLLVVALLGTLNVRDYGDFDVTTSIVETAFALPSATLEDAMLYTEFTVEDGDLP